LIELHVWLPRRYVGAVLKIVAVNKSAVVANREVRSISNFGVGEVHAPCNILVGEKAREVLAHSRFNFVVCSG